MLCKLVTLLLILSLFQLSSAQNTDCLLVGTVNGDVLCLDSESGTVKWTFKTGSALLDYNFEKLASEDLMFLPSVGSECVIHTPNL
jgi:Skp family chaperone for outer membrane proteins